MKTLVLKDGRKLAYHEYGDPNGKPLINCHGGLVNGQDIMFAHAAAKAAGVRIISPDRPGVGCSSIQRNRILLDWPLDVEELADQLGLTKFAVLGWSMGGPYAMAVAYILHERVSHLVVVAGCLELSDRVNFDQLNPMDKRFSKRSHSLPMVAESVYWSMGMIAKVAPKFFVKSTARKLSDSDAHVIMSEPRKNFVIPSTQALSHPKGLVQEYRVFVEPFGFKPNEIPVKTSIWQGTEDTLVPPAWAKEMNRTIANSKLYIIPSAGHFVAHTEIDQILKSLT